MFVVTTCNSEKGAWQDPNISDKDNRQQITAIGSCFCVCISDIDYIWQMLTAYPNKRPRIVTRRSCDRLDTTDIYGQLLSTEALYQFREIQEKGKYSNIPAIK